MRFGVGLWCLQSTAHTPRHHVVAYRELREDAALIERLGFEGIWLSEHHFFYDGYCPALLPAAASVLAATDRLRVGTGMLLLPLQDASRVAAGAADLARRSGGRFDLGVGLGYRETEFLGKGVPMAERLPRLLRGLDVLEAAGGGRAFPLWMGGATVRTAARAGARGHPILLSGALPASKVRELAAAHRQAWETRGRPGPGARRPAAGALRNVWVTDDRAEREAVLDWVRASYVLYAGLGWAVDAEGEHRRLDFARDGESAIADAVATTIVGPAGLVVEALQELAQAGVDYVALRLMLEGAPRPAIHSVLHRLAEGVLPRLASAVPV